MFKQVHELGSHIEPNPKMNCAEEAHDPCDVFNSIHETNISEKTDQNLQKINLAHRAYGSLHFVRNTDSSDTRIHNAH